MTAAVTVPMGAAVPSLARWGLTSDADLVYRTLITFGPRPLRILSTELGLPRQRIGDALAELRENGAAMAVADNRGAARSAPLWVGRPPADVIVALRMRRLRLVDRNAQAQQHRSVVHALNTMLTGVGIPAVPALPGALGSDVRYLGTRALLRERLAELVPQEQHEHLALNTEQAFDATARAGAPLSKVVSDLGVKVRVLGQPPADRDALAPTGTGELINGTSYQSRETTDTPIKLFVVDRRLALFPVDPLDFERGYLEVSQPAVVAALVALFDKHWAAGVDPRQQSVPMIVLSDRERDLTMLLALGHTDVSAAGRLRISARSVTNIMRNMMDRIGVENRFQLGLALGTLRVAEPPSLAGALAASAPTTPAGFAKAS
jgi:DNA-binding CsgD family transcriptional regulator